MADMTPAQLTKVVAGIPDGPARPGLNGRGRMRPAGHIGIHAGARLATIEALVATPGQRA